MERIGIRLSALVAILAISPIGRADGPWHSNIILELRSRAETRNNSDFNSSLDDHRFDLLGRLRVGFHVWNKAQGIEFFLQPQESYDQFSTPARSDNTQQIDLYTAYAGMKFAGRWTATVGRQELGFGEERLISKQDWTNFGRSWDAVRLDYAGRAKVSAFAGNMAINGANPVKAHPTFAGIYSTWQLRNGTLEGYLLYKKQAQPDGDKGIGAIGGRYNVRRHKTIANAEAIGEFGKSHDKDVRASMALLNISVPIVGFFRAEAEGVYASGGDPSDGTVKTFDQLFGSCHKYYGIADYQGLQNLRYAKLEVNAVPARGWKAAAQYHFFQLDNARDYWYGAGGVGGLRDPTGAAGRNVGTEFDLVVWYNPNPTWSVDGGWGHFMPGSFVKRLSPKDDAADFLYVEAKYRY